VEAELTEYSQRLQLATDSGKLAIWDWNVKDNIMFWDERMFELYGITHETFPNNVDAWINGLHPDDNKRAIEESGSALAGEKEYNTSFRVLHPDGAVKFLKANGIVIRDNDGKAVRMIGINSDITEQIQAEEERKIMEAHLQQAQKMEAIGTLAGGIAHDFNNILGAILGYAEMAYEDSLSGLVKPSDLNQVLHASHREKDLVKQILAFSRQAEAQKIPIRPVAMVKESLKLLRSSLPTTIDIQQNFDSETALILADPTQIYQLIMNLCTNAYHAMEEKGGTLSIFLENMTLTQQDLVKFPSVEAGHFVQLSIRDTGFGIAPEIQNRIFDPYFTTKDADKGTGMGLAIVHGIAKSYGGFITCRSEIGAGTVFEIYLPAILEQIVPESKDFEFIPVGTEHILFVDDEKMLAEMGKAMLERLGYKVTVETNSIEALQIIQNQPDHFDLVITDQTMPEMTGSDLARRILQIRPGMPIILCTGFSNLISEEKARTYGIQGFAMKPLAQKDLAVLIRKVLDVEGI
jgi:PAS domain S-box-containing protein